MLSQQQIGEIRRRVFIEGNGNIVGDHNTLIQRVEGGLHIRTDVLNVTLDAELLRELLRLPQSNIPVVPPEVPYLHSLIGKEAEKQALLELYQTVAASGKGMTVVLSGKPRSGRRALTQWLHQQVYLQGGAVAATRFWDTRLLPEEQTARLYWETPVMKSFGQRLAETYTQTSTALPHQEAWLNLVAQLTQQATSGAAISPDWPDTPLTLVRFVRQVARRQPLLLTVEYLDWADPIWIDLLRRMADEIAQDLPVLLVITLDAPAPLEQLPSEQHTESTRLAETLVVARQAREVYLGAVTPSDIAATLGPAVPALVEQLHALSAGDPFIVELLWEKWRAQQAVFQGWDGRWDINQPQAGGRVVGLWGCQRSRPHPAGARVGAC